MTFPFILFELDKKKLFEIYFWRYSLIEIYTKFTTE